MKNNSKIEKDEIKSGQNADKAVKKPIKLWKFRGYKELVPDPFSLKA